MHMNYGFRQLVAEMGRLSYTGEDLTARNSLLWDAFSDEEGKRNADPNLIVGKVSQIEAALKTGKMVLKIETYNESAGLTPPENMYRTDNNAAPFGYIKIDGFVSTGDDDKNVLFASLLSYGDSTVEEYTELDYSSKDIPDSDFRTECADFLIRIGLPERVVEIIQNTDEDYGCSHTDLDEVEIESLANGLSTLE